MYAVSKGDAEAARMLLENKADPYDVDYVRRTRCIL
jgi:ankyrin repeat protein